MKRLLPLLPLVMVAAIACAPFPPPTSTPPTSTPPTSTPPGPAVGQCFRNTVTRFDLKYNAYNQVDNIAVYNSTDGSCGLGVLSIGTAVVAADATAAVDACRSLYAPFTTATQAPAGALVPDPYPLLWTCSLTPSSR